MNCPKCKAATCVTDSRPTGVSVRRRRACKCGFKVTTFESPLDLAGMLDALRRRLRFLEEEVATVVDMANLYMTARIKRPKRGPSRRWTINPELLRRSKPPRHLTDEEKRRLAAAYRDNTAKELASAYGMSVRGVQVVLRGLGVTKRGPGTHAANGQGDVHV